MNNIRKYLDRNRLLLYSSIIIIAFAVFTVVDRKPKIRIQPVKETALSQNEQLIKELNHLKDRLAKLEPPEPVRIITAEHIDSPSEPTPLPVVMTEGRSIPFQSVFEDREWTRPSYEPYWHSEKADISSIPDRIHNAYHKLFVTPGTKTLLEEMLYNSGTYELRDKIILSGLNDEPADTLVILSIQFGIKNIFVHDNQISLVGTPSRKGVQFITINKYDIINSVTGEVIAKNNNLRYLVQLVTPDGYEVDYTNAMISI